MQDLCRIRARSKDKPFQDLSIGDLSDLDVDAPLEPHWLGLTIGNRVWIDGSLAKKYVRGTLIPLIAKQVYSSLLEVLIEKATKSLVCNQRYHMTLIDWVHDMDWMISYMGDRITELDSQIEALRASLAPEAIVAAEQ
ncbi:hypothetical protein MUK42_12060 [Musa troglodytarum]|uniref:Uncharacterized protein n=1 Tax=Musa troglodytarum TaxID=320322 RepID=A0A9E7GSR6_9LILI|nr:hypothetical protein MUK42_12060 [Musa troglodytarum]